MFTIFANIRINSETRLRHLKDSFFSFQGISDNWLVNVRGKFRNEALDFLKKNLGNRGMFFELLDDSRGWTVNALEMLPAAKYDYLLLWNEDHFNLAPTEIYAEIAEELKQSRADYMQYSWWGFGQLRQAFDEIKDIGFERFSSIDVVAMTPEKWAKIVGAGYKGHIISDNGIFEKNFFKKLLTEDQRRISLFDMGFLVRLIKGILAFFGIRSGREKWLYRINKLFFRNKLRRFSKETPFDLEHDYTRTDILPIRIALPKQELFACIDDDGGMEPGYQLIKRGLYPLWDALTLQPRPTPDFPNAASPDVVRINLKKGAVEKRRYYENTLRTEKLLEESMAVLSGRIKARYAGREAIFSPHEESLFFANIGYEMEALEDSAIAIQTMDLSSRDIIYINGGSTRP